MHLADTLYEILLLLDLLWEVYDKDEAGIWKALDERIYRILEFIDESAAQGVTRQSLSLTSKKQKFDCKDENEDYWDSGVTDVPSVILGTERRGEHTYSF